MFLYSLIVRPTGSKRFFGDYFLILFLISIIAYLLLREPVDISALSTNNYLEPANQHFLTDYTNIVFLLLSFGVFQYFNQVFVLKKIKWSTLVSDYEFKGDKDKLDLVVNTIEYGGYVSILNCSFSLDDNGIYLIPRFLNKLFIKPLFLPWSILSLSVGTFRKQAFGKPFGREKDIIIIEAKYTPGFRLRIRVGELKIDFERALLSKAG